MVEEWSVEPLCSQIHRFILQNRAQNTREQKHREEGQCNWGPPRVGSHHYPWWPLATRPCCLPNVAFWCIFWSAGFALDQHILGLLGFFCNLSWLGLAQKHLLISWFRLVNLNSAKTLKISKTTHNTCNRGINRITIYFNPPKRLLKINPCKCNTYHSPMFKLLLVLKQNTIQD